MLLIGPFEAFVPVFRWITPACINSQKAMDAAISVIYLKSKTLANGEYLLMLRIAKDCKGAMKNLCRRKRQKPVIPIYK